MASNEMDMNESENNMEIDCDRITSDRETTQSEKDTTNNNTHGERLMIARIINENFKSYAGKKILGPFHKSFTSIVGPNGSGKSNVIDSMLFVFGYRSKKIRSKKLSLLIHNSENHKNLTYCTVTVVFQTIIDKVGDDFDVVPRSEFTISRTARLDGSSDYYINQKRSNFKEVGQLLRKSGIDLDHNRFLILQGEVEQISMMKPKAENEHDEGMLEYLEDIIGSSSFKEPIEMLINKVEELNEARGEKLNRVKVVEKEKDQLEGDKNNAIEFLEIENEMSLKRNLLLRHYIALCEKSLAESIEKCKAVEESKILLQNQLKELEGKRVETSKAHKETNALYSKLTKERDAKKKRYTEFENHDIKLNEDLKHRRENSKKLEKALEKEKSKLTELIATPEKKQAELEQLETGIKKLEAEKVQEDEKLKEIMIGLKSETEGLQAEKTAAETKLLQKQQTVNETKSKLEIAKSELEIYTGQYTNAQKKLDELKANMEMSKVTLKETLEEIEYCQKNLPQMKKELASAEKSLSAACSDEEKLTAKVKSTRTKVEETRSALQATKNRNGVLDALMDQKQKNKLQGIHGRLGDLGSIDDKYDVAISTACGPLDYIVVETMDDAQKALEFLKRGNIGSTTFIALDKVEHLRKSAEAKIKTPENVSRLVDLVKIPNQKLMTAFYFGLRNTLVATDLDQATRIAYPKDGKRHRVVTISGDLIEASGTLSGGGKKVSRGRMGSCAVTYDVSPKTLQDNEECLNQCIGKLEELKIQKQALEEKVAELKATVAEHEHKLEKGNLEKRMKIDNQKIMLAKQKELNAEVKSLQPDPAKTTELENTVSRFDKEFTKASSAAKNIENEVQSLHDQIMAAGSSKIKPQQAKIDSINRLLDEASNNVTKITHAIKSAERNTKKCQEKVTSLEKEVKDNDASIAAVETELEELVDQAQEVMDAFEEAQEKLSAIENSVNTFRSEIDAIDKEDNEIRTKELDVQKQLENHQLTVNTHTSKNARWQEQLSSLSLHVIDPNKGTPQFPEANLDELLKVDETDMMYVISQCEEKLNLMSPDLSAIDAYRKKEELYLSRVGELEEVTKSRDDTRQELENLRKERNDMFMAGFAIITMKLKEMYQMITLGGDAELELVDSLDPFSEGVVFSVRPPKKSWKNISNLSGGEKTLSSLALVFALHHFKPTPLYVMDEIDAALDFKNVSIVANYIKERTKNAQFIIISLRNNMFELADRLIGIYKTDNCTKSVPFNPDKVAVPIPTL